MRISPKIKTKKKSTRAGGSKTSLPKSAKRRFCERGWCHWGFATSKTQVGGTLSVQSLMPLPFRFLISSLCSVISFLPSFFPSLFAGWIRPDNREEKRECEYDKCSSNIEGAPKDIQRCSHDRGRGWWYTVLSTYLHGASRRPAHPTSGLTPP